MVTYKLSTL